MRIRRSGIVLFACAAIAFAGPQLAMSVSNAAVASPATVASSATRHAPTHPMDIVPLRGAKNAAGFDQVFTNMDYNGGAPSTM